MSTSFPCVNVLSVEVCGDCDDYQPPHLSPKYSQQVPIVTSGGIQILGGTEFATMDSETYSAAFSPKFRNLPRSPTRLIAFTRVTGNQRRSGLKGF